MEEKTTIQITKDTKWKLLMLNARLRARSYEEALRWLLDQPTPKKMLEEVKI